MVNTQQQARVALPVGSSVCQCGGCGAVFKSVTSFDKHRSGDMDYRRCLTPDEMRAAGMSVNGLGQWIASAYGGPARGTA